MAESRLALVDQAKAVGIVLVVAGHIHALPAPLLHAIFLFHMPLFFFLSGALVREDKLAQPTSRHAVELARRLLLPYCFYFGLSLAFWLATRGLGTRGQKFGALDWYAPLAGFLSGGLYDSIVNPALWFLPCLALTAAVFHALRRHARAGSVLMLAAASALVLLPLVVQAPPASWPLVAVPGGRVSDSALPWRADVLPASLLFYAAGHLLRPWLPRAAALAALTRLALGVAAAAALIGLGLANGVVDLNLSLFGQSSALFIGVAALGIAATLALGSLLPDGAVVRWLAANSLVIFATHTLLLVVVSGVGKLLLRLSADTLASWPWGLAQLVATFILLVPLVHVLRAAAPVASGAAARDRWPLRAEGHAHL
jgi:acyltransferase